jgi:hypothetical protein
MLALRGLELHGDGARALTVDRIGTAARLQH